MYGGNRINQPPWIEDNVKRDSNIIRQTISKYTQEYEHIRSRFESTNPVLRENKSETTEFFAEFFKMITENELDVYNHITMTKWNDVYNNYNQTSSGSGGGRKKIFTSEDNYIENLNFKIERIKSAGDLPRPSILESIRYQYDSGLVNKNTNDTSGPYKFMPKPIYTYIREKAEWLLQFKYRVNDRDITLHFITFPESRITVCDRPNIGGGSISSNGHQNQMCAQEIAIYQTYAYKVFLWLTIVSKMADSECSGESLNIYFYMTPFKKNIPSATPTTREGDTLSAIHVNTGVTRNCQENGEIIIYRFEEWFKVLIHETMHNFNMDFIESGLSQMNNRLREAFFIPQRDVLVFETYTEAWARIIYTMFECYFDPDVRNQSTFIHHVREKLEQNAFFSTLQLTKVLELMELKYAHITIPSKENVILCRTQYKEESNIYAYYILGGILSVYALPFISWCIRNNNHNSSTIKNNYRRNHIIDSIRFLNNNNDSSLIRLADFLKECSRDSRLLSMVAFCEKKLNHIISSSKGRTNRDDMRVVTTLRMTI
jgi:hypothetical protein